MQHARQTGKGYGGKRGAVPQLGPPHSTLTVEDKAFVTMLQSAAETVAAALGQEHTATLLTRQELRDRSAQLHEGTIEERLRQARQVAVQALTDWRTSQTNVETLGAQVISAQRAWERYRQVEQRYEQSYIQTTALCASLLLQEQRAQEDLLLAKGPPGGSGSSDNEYEKKRWHQAHTRRLRASKQLAQAAHRSRSPPAAGSGLGKGTLVKVPTRREGEQPNEGGQPHTMSGLPTGAAGSVKEKEGVGRVRLEE